MRAPWCLLPLAVTCTLGCDKGKPPPTASSAAPSQAAPASATAAQEAPPAPENLDVDALQKALKCAAEAKTGPCAVLASMKACSPWNGSVPSGDGRWLGKGYLVQDGKTTEQITIVRSKRTSLAEVGPGQLPAKIGIAEIPKEEKNAVEQAERAIRTYERHDVPAKSNAGVEYVKQLAEWPDAFATSTTGGHVYVLSHGGAFLCMGPKTQLVLVRRAATHGSTGEGLYAELWPTSW